MSAKGYTFTYKGTKITLPSFKDIPVGALRKSRKASDDMDRAFLIFEEILTEKQLALIDTIPLTEFSDILSKWTEGAGLGESSES